MDYDLARVLYSPVQFLEFHVRNFLYQILCGLKYVHSADVIHRDLKPGNILVLARGVLKICDFGLARAIHVAPRHGLQAPDPITNYVATRWYRAPELILRLSNYGKPVDMWAVGCILGELYGRQPLMPGKSSIHQLHEIVKYLGSPREKFILQSANWAAPANKCAPVDWAMVYPFASSESFLVLDLLLKWDPQKRLTVEQLLKHLFFANIRDAGGEPRNCTSFKFGREEDERDLAVLQVLLKEEVAAFQTEKVKNT